MKNTFGSILAGLAGIATVVIPTSISDAILNHAGYYPSHGQPAPGSHFAVATVYRVIFGLAGGYVTARLAPNRPVGHSLVLGALGLVLTLAGTIATWDKGPDFGPHWYPIGLMVLTMPQSWAGAKMWLMQAGARS